MLKRVPVAGWPRFRPPEPMPEAQLSQLTAEITELGLPTRAFYVQILMACLIATLGLHADSTAVIIGAMIVAPLMAPIVAIAGAIARGRQRTLRMALFTMATGSVIAVAVAALITLAVTVPALTGEVLSRTRPSLLDMGIALAAGMIAAYARTRPSIKDSLPGVAIAVALMPPLCTVGITLVAGEWRLALGALTLFVTNLAGIILAGVGTLYLAGYADFDLMRRRDLLGWLALALIVVFPLTVSLQTLLVERRVATSISTVLKRRSLLVQSMELVDVDVRRLAGRLTVRVVVRTSDVVPAPNQVRLLEAFLRTEIQQPDLALVLDVQQILHVEPPPTADPS